MAAGTGGWHGSGRAFRGGERKPSPVRSRAGAGYWLDEPEAAATKAMIAELVAAGAALAPRLSPEERGMADYRLVSTAGFPAYLGGPFAMATHGNDEKFRNL